MVAAGILPGVDVENFWGALVVAAIVGGAERRHPAGARRVAIAADARARLPARAGRGRPHAPGGRRGDRRRAHGRQFRLGAARGTRRCGGERCAAVLFGSDDMASIRIAQRIARGRGSSPRPTCRGSSIWRSTGSALPVLRRAMRDGNAPNMARWARDTHRSRRVGDRSLLADGCEPGGDLAGLERGHLGVPLGREGDGDDDDLLGAAGLRGDRAPSRDRDRPAGRRRREPRQPPLRRGGGRDPHRQPDGGGEEVEPRLPRVLRERRERDADARPLRVGGHPRVDRGASRDPPGRASARPPRRHLPADAGRALRLRA